MLRAGPARTGKSGGKLMAWGGAPESTKIGCQPDGCAVVRFYSRMKKIAFIAFLLAVCAAAGRAQESRQDISLSGTGIYEPFMASSTDVQVSSNVGEARWSATGSCLRPRARSKPTTASPTEQDSLPRQQHQQLPGEHPHPGDFVCLRPQLSLTANSIRLSKAGPGVLIFLPIRNSGTTSLDVKQQTGIGGPLRRRHCL